MDSFFTLAISQKNSFIYFAMCLSIPSLLLYCAEIGTIARHAAFHTPFHALFIIRAIPDLLYTLDSYYGFRLPNILGPSLLPFYQQLPNWALTLFMFLTSYTFHADNLATGFLLLHRLTAIAYPVRHEKVWKKLLPMAFLAVFCVPMYNLAWFKAEGAIQVLGGNGQEEQELYFVIGEAQNSNFLPAFVQINAVLSILFLLVCLLINLATFLAYRRRQKALLSQQNGGDAEKIQRRLLAYAVLTFGGHMLIALLMASDRLFRGQEWLANLQIGIAICLNTQNMLALGFINAQYPWIVDLGTVVLPSWLLLWASPNFRRQLFNDFVPKAILRRFYGNGASVEITHAVAVKQNSWTGGVR